MKKTVPIILLIPFLGIIFGVPFWQSIKELRTGEGIRFLDLGVDTFLTPMRRADRIHTLLQKMEAKASAIERLEPAAAKRRALNSTETPTADKPAVDTPAGEVSASLLQDSLARLREELLFLAEDALRACKTINRYVQADSGNKLCTRLDTLREQAARLDEGGNIAIHPQDEGENDVAIRQDRRVKSFKAQLEMVLNRQSETGPATGTLLALEHFFRYTVFNHNYLRAYEGELEESSFVVQLTRPWMQFVRFQVLGDLGDKAQAGKGGWYFYKPGVDYLIRPYMGDPRSVEVDPNDKPLTEDPIRAIETFKRQLENLGIELLVVIVPGKPTIYPERITKSEFPRPLSHSHKAMEELRQKGIQVVDLFAPLLRAKQEDSPGKELYMAKDTHWRLRGVQVTARVVAERIRQYSWFGELGDSVEYMEESVTVDRMGDVPVMTRIPEYPTRKIERLYASEKVLAHKVFSVQRDSTGEIVRKAPYRDRFRDAEILILGDSFSRVFQTDAPRSAGWISHLARELGLPLASIVSEGGASTLVRQKLARNQRVLKNIKLVVWEFVERDFRYGAEGWKDVELSGEI